MASQIIKEYIDNNPVVIFSKTYCSYSSAAKRTMGAHKAEPFIVELDNRRDGAELQDALEELSGQRSVPNIYIGHKHIGGNSDLQKLASRGDLNVLLKEAGAL